MATRVGGHRQALPSGNAHANAARQEVVASQAPRPPKGMDGLAGCGHEDPAARIIARSRMVSGRNARAAKACARNYPRSPLGPSAKAELPLQDRGGSMPRTSGETAPGCALASNEIKARSVRLPST